MHRYREHNVQASSIFRKYSNTIVPFLRNRPHSLIKHVMPRYTESQHYSKSDVVQISDGVFSVKSATSNNTVYTVAFDKEGMPHCECNDWQRFHLPCKHFCAVFRQYDNYGWDALALEYRESVFFQLDTDVLGDEHMSIDVDSVSWHDEQPKEDEDLDSNDHNDHSDHDRDNTTCLVKAKKCRDILTDIINLTYLISDVSALEHLHESLRNLHSTVKMAAAHDDGLTLNSGHIPTPKHRQRKAGMQFIFHINFVYTEYVV